VWTRAFPAQGDRRFGIERVACEERVEVLRLNRVVSGRTLTKDDAAGVLAGRAPLERLGLSTIEGGDIDHPKATRFALHAVDLADHPPRGAFFDGLSRLPHLRDVLGDRKTARGARDCAIGDPVGTLGTVEQHAGECSPNGDVGGSSGTM
jgi:hypothetical protein